MNTLEEVRFRFFLKLIRSNPYTFSWKNFNVTCCSLVSQASNRLKTTRCNSYVSLQGLNNDRNHFVSFLVTLWRQFSCYMFQIVVTTLLYYCIIYRLFRVFRNVSRVTSSIFSATSSRLTSRDRRNLSGTTASPGGKGEKSLHLDVTSHISYIIWHAWFQSSARCRSPQFARNAVIMCRMRHVWHSSTWNSLKKLPVAEKVPRELATFLGDLKTWFLQLQLWGLTSDVLCCVVLMGKVKGGSFVTQQRFKMQRFPNPHHVL